MDIDGSYQLQIINMLENKIWTRTKLIMFSLCDCDGDCGGDCDAPIWLIVWCVWVCDQSHIGYLLGRSGFY